MAVLRTWRWCPRCRTELVHDRGRVECTACGFMHYANPVPAVSALVADELGRILLARRAHEPARGRWDTPGGFLDEAEEPEAALRRELREETGVEIEIGEFVGIYPDTYGEEDEAPYVLNLVWEVRIASGELEPADDVSELRWFSPPALPPDEELAFPWIAALLRRRLVTKP